MYNLETYFVELILFGAVCLLLCICIIVSALHERCFLEPKFIYHIHVCIYIYISYTINIYKITGIVWKMHRTPNTSFQIGIFMWSSFRNIDLFHQEMQN